MHARLDAGRVNILTRRGNDWTDKYPVHRPELLLGCGRRTPIWMANFAVCSRTAGPRSTSSRTPRYRPGRLVFFLFDLLFLDGENLMEMRLVDRKARLEMLIPTEVARHSGMISPGIPI